MSSLADSIAAIQSRYPAITSSTFRDQTRLVVPAETLASVMAELKNTHGCDYLVDVTCVDYLKYRDASDRFGLIYLLTNTVDNWRITIRVPLNEPNLTVPSVEPLWAGAGWMEREVYDMFGIMFEGHSDLRRILLPDEFTAHPLRKDYPMQGRGERHNFPVITRSQA
jgi:NADH-quinone oxidoreductase subunit C